MEHMGSQFIEAENRLIARKEDERVDDALYSLVARLTKVTKEITFACVPESGASYYLGLSDYLERHAPAIGNEAYRVVKVLEDKYRFLELLSGLEIAPKVSVFIGEENLIPELESSAMVVKAVEIEGVKAYV
jgi:transcriptional regulator of heat shock response